MDLRQFRYFIEVADRLSFTKAAKRLHVSQPTLGQQIRALEQTLGTDLLARSASGLALTQAGVAFLDWHAPPSVRRSALSKTPALRPRDSWEG
jgi:DNA-binding transcriptional LysR family regulator